MKFLIPRNVSKAEGFKIIGVMTYRRWDSLFVPMWEGVAGEIEVEAKQGVPVIYEDVEGKTYYKLLATESYVLVGDLPQPMPAAA